MPAIGVSSLPESVIRLRDWALHEGQHLGYQDLPRREALRLRAFAETDPTLPFAIRHALAFAHLLDTIALQIGEDDVLAGHFSPASASEQSSWEDERWQRTEAILPPFHYSSAVEERMHVLRTCAGDSAWFGEAGQGHSNVNYALVLQRGMRALADEADMAAEQLGDPERAATSRAMAIALRGVIRYAERLAEQAEALAQTATPERAVAYRRMAASCRRVPAEPARTFFDALQAVWITYLTVGMSESPSANSLGCADRYLYPYYAHDLATGELSPEDAKVLLAHFLIKCGSYSEGQSLTLGGPNTDGTDATNDLTRLFLHLIPELRLPEPIISVRIHPGTCEDDLLAMARITAQGNGQPSYYADARCRAMLATRGIADDAQERLAINSCMGVVVSGAELCDMWGGIVGLPLCLEMAIARGVTADGVEIPAISALCPDEYTSLDDLLAGYAAVSQYLIGTLIDKHREETAYRARWTPNPLISALLDDCRQRGLDRFAGGPRYHSVVIEGIGWANVSDSLLAIDEVVFTKGLTDLPTLLVNARNKFADAPEILRALRACPKYGNDDAQADEMARRILELFIDAVNRERKPDEPQEYLPSLHTMDHNVYAGLWCPVSFDGRPYGAPLNKQIGPSVWAATTGPTAVLASAARIPTDQLPGGQALDISLPPSLFTSPAGTAQFTAMLKTYLALGGSDLQINVADPDTLRAAQEDPAAYGHLIVRIAGYSEFFVKLNRLTQDDLITRMEKGL